MATCSFLLSHVPTNGWPPRKSNPATSHFSERYKFEATRRIAKPDKRVSGSTLCCMKLGASPSVEFPPLDTKPLEKILELRAVAEDLKIDSSEPSHVASDFIAGLVLADLDAATAKIAIGILGPSLSAFGFLFIARIVMSWYPNIPVGKFPYVIAYAPTEPLLVVTRKLIPPLGGVDVTPVVWFGLVSFLNEILVGPQGLLVLLSQQINQ